MKRPVILSVGEVLWDLFPEGARFGGATANFACHAAMLGGEVSILSSVGNDQRGDDAIAILQGFGIDTSLMQQTSDVPTGTVGVSVDAVGKPSFEIQAESAWDRVAWTNALEARLAAVDAIYFGTLGQRGQLARATIRRAAGFAKARNILRVFDVNLRRPFYDAALIRDSMALASVLKLSDDEIEEVATACGVTPDAKPESTLRSLLARCELDLAVMTRGAEGAILVSAEDTIFQPGFPTAVRDTVGAGDAFTAALTVGLLRRTSLEIIVRNACQIAAAVCAHSGAVPRLPSL